MTKRNVKQARELFECNLSLVKSILPSVAGRSGLDGSDTEDFVSFVMLKLVEGDYRVFRSFAGKSSLRTFLWVVVRRLLIDYQTHLWGKWRPSAAAKRMGSVAVKLERLITRDGFNLSEACSILRVNEGVKQSTGELEQMAARLPRRYPRRFVSLDGLEQRASSDEFNEDPPDCERAEWQGRLSRALREALLTLPAEDRLMLKMRYRDSMKICRIAKILGLPAKQLYRRFERILRHLRVQMEERGWDREALRDPGWLAGQIQEPVWTSPSRPEARHRVDLCTTAQPERIQAIQE